MNPRRAALALLLLLATVAAYAPGLGAPFQLDDRGVIVDDARVHDLGTAWASLGHGLRPLLRLTYALSWAQGLGPLGFHLGNLAIHLGCVALVGGLARRATGRADAAWLAAATFALHPLGSEAVIYASGRSASLSTLLALGAVTVWVDATRAGSRWRAHGLAAVLAVAAALAKETTVATVLAVVLWDRTVERTPWRALPGRAAGLLVATVGLALGALLHDAVYHLLLDAVGQRPLGEALAREAEGVGYLASRLVLLRHLSIDPGLGFRPPWAPGVLEGVAAALGVVAVAWRTRSPAVALGLSWWLLHLLVPYALLPRVDVLNERHAYLADAGLAVAAGAWMAVGWTRSAGVRVAIVAVLLGLGAATAARTWDYRSEEALWTATTATSPGNPRAWRNLAAVLEAEGRLVEARDAYAKALVREPAYASARDGLRRTLRALEQGR